MADFSALILGSSGLVGGHLLKALLNDKHCTRLNILVRNKILDDALKLKQTTIDFKNLDAHQSSFNVDVVFCCLGTTIKKAGSRSAFRKIDFDLVLQAAQLSVASGVKKFVFVSSVGANATHGSFYLRTKGELEERIFVLAFPETIVVRPSLLLGKRVEFRWAEWLAARCYSMLQPLVDKIAPQHLQRYLPVQAEKVAKLMLDLVNKQTNSSAIEHNIKMSDKTLLINKT